MQYDIPTLASFSPADPVDIAARVNAATKQAKREHAPAFKRKPAPPLPSVCNYSRTRVADARDYEIMLRYMRATLRERSKNHE